MEVAPVDAEERSDDAAADIAKCIDGGTERDDGADANDGERLGHPVEESVITEAVEPNENNNSSLVSGGVFDGIRGKIVDETGEKEGESKQICVFCNEEIVPNVMDENSTAAGVVEEEKEETQGDIRTASVVDAEEESNITASAEEKCDAHVEQVAEVEVAEPEKERKEERQQDGEEADVADDNVNASADNRCEPEPVPERKVAKPEVAKPEVAKPKAVEPEEPV